MFCFHCREKNFIDAVTMGLDSKYCPGCGGKGVTITSEDDAVKAEETEEADDDESSSTSSYDYSYSSEPSREPTPEELKQSVEIKEQTAKQNHDIWVITVIGAVVGGVILTVYRGQEASYSFVANGIVCGFISWCFGLLIVVGFRD